MTSLPSLEARVAHVEGIVSGLEARISSIEARLGRIEDRIAALEGRIQSNFQWIVGLMLPMWISVILAVLLK